MGRPITHSLVKALRAVPGFDRLGGQELLCIVGASVNLRWSEKSHVFRKGAPGEALYIVLEGKVKIYDEVDGEEVDIATTGAGDYFGEMSLLADTTHTKSAKALEDSELLVLMKEPFGELLASNEELARAIHETLETRRAETDSRYDTERAVS
ncbi:MAG: cyclic nucleotide-binding domain-containing protein [Actinomycetota bacterium]|nr:cyclic nucleotide-binding domain-containing protein [Actinomycetota bacterium]